jgi:leucyl-tRNA synthetase
LFAKVVAEHGADALRLYLMFMGPLEAAKPWQSRQIMGVVRFMGKVAAVCGRAAGRKREGDGGAEQGAAAAAATAAATLSAEEVASVASCRSLLHRTIRKVGRDYEALAFNTALSALMVLTTDLGKLRDVFARAAAVAGAGGGGGGVGGGEAAAAAARALEAEATKALAVMLSPLAPHLAEEMWHRLGHDEVGCVCVCVCARARARVCACALLVRASCGMPHGWMAR